MMASPASAATYAVGVPQGAYVSYQGNQFYSSLVVSVTDATGSVRSLTFQSDSSSPTLADAATDFTQATGYRATYSASAGTVTFTVPDSSSVTFADGTPDNGFGIGSSPVAGVRGGTLGQAYVPIIVPTGGAPSHAASSPIAAVLNGLVPFSTGSVAYYVFLALAAIAVVPALWFWQAASGHLERMKADNKAASKEAKRQKRRTEEFGKRLGSYGVLAKDRPSRWSFHGERRFRNDFHETDFIDGDRYRFGGFGMAKHERDTRFLDAGLDPDDFKDA